MQRARGAGYVKYTNENEKRRRVRQINIGSSGRTKGGCAVGIVWWEAVGTSFTFFGRKESNTMTRMRKKGGHLLNA